MRRRAQTAGVGEDAFVKREDHLGGGIAARRAREEAPERPLGGAGAPAGASRRRRRERGRHEQEQVPEGDPNQRRSGPRQQGDRDEVDEAYACRGEDHTGSPENGRPRASPASGCSIMT